MISALAWVPRGVAKAMPEVVEPTEEELDYLRESAEAEEEDGEEDSDSDMEAQDEQEEALARARAVASAIKSGKGKGKSKDEPGGDTNVLDAALKELDLDNYDDEDDMELPGLLGGKLGGTKEDPYLQLGSDDDSEIEDFNIRDSDLLILAARNDEDVSSLEVWLYEEADSKGEANIYVHHEIMLPAFPLSLAWLDCNPSGSSDQPGNFVAVGTFMPEIEIWNLDMIDSVEPAATLGGVLMPDAPVLGEEAEGLSRDDKKKLKKKIRKKKSKTKPTLKEGSHEDAVMSLSWNPEFRNVLASGSADYTVKVWDVTTQECKQTFTHHAGKVQSVCWNPAEASVMLSGGFDKVAALIDVRTQGGSAVRWDVDSDVEAMTWCPHDPTCFLVSCEDGLVKCFDARKGEGSAAVYTLQAHDKPTCTMSFSPDAPGLLVTGSTDKKLKLWDVTDNKPSLIATEEPKVGAIFSAGFTADSPFLVAAAGAKGTVVVWDTMSNAAVAAKYGGKKR